MDSREYVCDPDTMRIKILDASFLAVAVALYYGEKEIFKRVYHPISVETQEAFIASVQMLCDELTNLAYLQKYKKFVSLYPEEYSNLVEYASNCLKEVRKKSGLLIWRR